MALDSSKTYPDNPLAELVGHPFQARRLDKIRAKHAGTLGDCTPFPALGQ